MEKLTYTPIGLIHSPFKKLTQMPIQPSGAEGIRGAVEVYPQYAEGLKDLDGFSHIILIYHFHLSENYSLTVTPFLGQNPRGVFATRAPKRPNPIGIPELRLLKVEGNILQVEGVDIIDGTPLLDIKPYVPDFDTRGGERIGWLSGKTDEVHKIRSGKQFMR